MTFGQWVGDDGHITGLTARLHPEPLRSGSADAAHVGSNTAVYGRLDLDTSHPYRQTEVVKEVNRKLPTGVKINAHGVLSVRRAHGTETNPMFFHQPRFRSPQYSDSFIDWIVEEYAHDKDFFANRELSATQSRRAGPT